MQQKSMKQRKNKTKLGTILLSALLITGLVPATFALGSEKDMAAPVISILTPTIGRTNNLDVVVNVSDETGIYDIWVGLYPLGGARLQTHRILANGVQDGIFTKSLDALVDGDYELQVTARDIHGNTTARYAEARTFFTVDRTAPVITINTPTGGLTNSVDVEVSVADEAGIYDIWVGVYPLGGARLLTQRITANGVMTGTFSTALEGLADGDYELQVTARDLLKNTTLRFEEARVFFTLSTTTKEEVSEEPADEVYEGEIADEPSDETYEVEVSDEPSDDAYEVEVSDEPSDDAYEVEVSDEPSDEAYEVEVSDEPSDEAYEVEVPEAPSDEVYEVEIPEEPVVQEPTPIPGGSDSDNNPNAGPGNNSGNNNPNAGSGNNSGNNNPNAGSGNHSGNNNPNAGSGNHSGNNNPNAGPGNHSGNNNPNAGSGNHFGNNNPNAGTVSNNGNVNNNANVAATIVEENEFEEVEEIEIEEIQLEELVASARIAEMPETVEAGKEVVLENVELEEDPSFEIGFWGRVGAFLGSIFVLLGGMFRR